ncbi:hypothetical protein BDW22DRAFT_228337 [Trametopsis cervina]|nr:hypothetical protein BDW22DRAFT_228337 [Trametopsis cervina]
MTMNPLIIADDKELSSNAHTPDLGKQTFSNHKTAEFEIPTRHPHFCFDDGSVAILCGHLYFLVHSSLLALHSPILKEMVDASGEDGAVELIEGRPTLRLPHMPDEMSLFLKAIYGLLQQKDVQEFSSTSVLLRLATTYDIFSIRTEMLRLLQCAWPTTLAQWEIREKNATNDDGLYSPRDTMAHPILIVELAREVNAPELLPSAFYDLSRYLPSQLSAGHTDPNTGIVRYLSTDDMFKVFRGKEQAARYFSTFIVKELEGRTPSQWCHNRAETQPARKRRCQVAYEAVTYTLLRDVNGLVLNRNSDPLYAISDSLLMQTREDTPGTNNRAALRSCEACRLEYAAVVEIIREEFWRKLPEWFELDVPNWM